MAAESPFQPFVQIGSIKSWPDFDALDVIKTKKAPFERRPESPDSDFDVEEDEEFGATGKL